jgi:hypothetical protein
MLQARQERIVWSSTRLVLALEKSRTLAQAETTSSDALELARRWNDEGRRLCHSNEMKSNLLTT